MTQHLDLCNQASRSRQANPDSEERSSPERGYDSTVLRLISHSWRSWKNAKGVALLSILALAVGIGSATAIFTVVNRVLLKPLPYSHADRWVALFRGSTLGSEADGYSALSVADLVDYQQRSHSFEVFGNYNITSDFNLSSPSLVEHVDGAEITPSLLNNVAVNPILGHLFQESDGLRVVMLSERLWRRLGSGSAVLGTSITLNGQSYTVAGVMPAWFQLPIVNVSSANVHNDVWIPVNPPKRSRAQAPILRGLCAS
jgi:putative ABC transport system permease protein